MNLPAAQLSPPNRRVFSSDLVRALFAVSVIGVTVGSFTGCKGNSDTTADSTTTDPTSGVAAEDAAPSTQLALPVTAESARDGDLVLRVNTTGQIRSDAAIKMRAEAAGTISELLVKPGARIAKGQVLVKLDPYPFDLAVREAQAVADESEQKFLESFVPESLVTGVGPTPEQRKALMNRAGLTGARLRLERARYELARAVITSPVDGMVDIVDVAAGERVSAGQQLLNVVDTRNLRIEAQVLEHDLPLIRTGGEAMVMSAGAPGKAIRGRIDAVLPMVDSLTRAGRAIVRVVGDGTLRPGMYADVQLEASRLMNRRLVPTRAIIERDGRPLVFVVKDGRAQWTYILPGRSNGVETEVLPDSITGVIPVNPGDEVIVEGHLTLTHDAPVRVQVLRETSSADTTRRRNRR